MTEKEEKTLEELAKEKLEREAKDAEKAKLREELRKEIIAEMEAKNLDKITRAFESRKENLKKKYPELASDIDEVEDPESLNELIELSKEDDEEEETKEPTKGKAVLPSSKKGDKETLQDLYNVLGQKFVDPKIKQLARQKIDKLWKGIETKHKQKFIKGLRKVKEGEIEDES